MQNRINSIKAQAAATSALVGAGSVVASVATGVPHNRVVADVLALRNDQIAVAHDFWGSVSVFDARLTAVHPGQGNLFDQS